MEPVGAFGIAIDAKLDERLGRISSIDVLTPDCGIVRWFNRSPSPSKFDCVFEDVEIIGDRTTDTAGNFYDIKILSKNAAIMKKNGSYDHAKTFTETLRRVVFDGVPLEGLFRITERAIKNFTAELNANVVLLKALYLLCREEGYAVDSLWVNSLSDFDGIFVREVIASKFAHYDADRTKNLAEALRQWILSL
ncbi:MAG: hypothetical protein LBB18_00275 [Puniceicoccales bacterium]|jgi:hypothetical protein|nr:hypothetical protein [Puniceicoccales bacterium]